VDAYKVCMVDVTAAFDKMTCECKTGATCPNGDARDTTACEAAGGMMDPETCLCKLPETCRDGSAVRDVAEKCKLIGGFFTERNCQCELRSEKLCPNSQPIDAEERKCKEAAGVFNPDTCECKMDKTEFCPDQSTTFAQALAQCLEPATLDPRMCYCVKPALCPDGKTLVNESAWGCEKLGGVFEPRTCNCLKSTDRMCGSETWEAAKEKCQTVFDDCVCKVLPLCPDGSPRDTECPAPTKKDQQTCLCVRPPTCPNGDLVTEAATRCEIAAGKFDVESCKCYTGFAEWTCTEGGDRKTKQEECRAAGKTFNETSCVCSEQSCENDCAGVLLSGCFCKEQMTCPDGSEPLASRTKCLEAKAGAIWIGYADGAVVCECTNDDSDCPRDTTQSRSDAQAQCVKNNGYFEASDCSCLTAESQCPSGDSTYGEAYTKCQAQDLTLDPLSCACVASLEYKDTVSPAAHFGVAIASVLAALR